MSDKSRERLVVTMEGLPLHGGNIPVGVFLSVIGGLRKLMRQIAERQTGKKGGGMEFLISDLSHSSPASVEISPGGDPAIGGRVVAHAENVFVCIAKGDVENIPDPECDAVETIVAPYRNKKLNMESIQRLNGALAGGYPLVNVTKKFVVNLDKRREGELRGVTTISGKVEMIDLHSSPIKLVIYPRIGGPVAWYLPNNARDTAIKTIGKRVSVTGDARYRPEPDNPGVQRPYRIDGGTDKIDIFGSEEENTRLFAKLRGAFPDLTGGKDTVEYLRELRGEND